LRDHRDAPSVVRLRLEGAPARIAHLEWRQGVGELIDSTRIGVEKSMLEKGGVNTLQNCYGMLPVPLSVLFSLEFANGRACVSHDFMQRLKHLVRDRFDLSIEAEDAPGNVPRRVIAELADAIVGDRRPGCAMIGRPPQRLDGKFVRPFASLLHVGRLTRTADQQKNRQRQ
jgi:hypothetical protein